MNKKSIFLIFLVAAVAISIYISNTIIPPQNNQQNITTCKDAFKLCGTQFNNVPSPPSVIVNDNYFTTDYTFPQFYTLTIKYKTMKIAEVTDTKSMEPLINKNTKVVETTSFTQSDIQVGDIISFTNTNAFGNNVALHRVIEQGTDEQGWYAITKGDNNVYSDGKTRFSNIQGLVIAIIY